MTPSFTPLHRGARVAIVAPSGAAKPSLIEHSLTLMRSWGLEPVLGPHVGAGHPRADYLSAPDIDRAADLQWAWTDPTIDAIFCARGGYGSIRMLDLLDVDALRSARAKPIFGSSDATAIAEFWLERLGVGFWFAPMLATEPMVSDPAAMADLHRAVFEPVVGHEFRSPAATTLVSGTATGRLIGGNLSLLALTLGDRGRPPLDNSGTIALLEEVTEPTYRVDGFLTALLRAGWFDGVAGVALGGWLDCGPADEIRALCLELLGPLGVPLVWELGFGHDVAAQSMPLGATGTLFADEHPRLRITAVD